MIEVQHITDKDYRVGNFAGNEFELYLTVRALNCLEYGRIKSLLELLKHTDSTLQKIPNIGIKTFLEIKNALAFRGLKLGMTDDEINQNPNLKKFTFCGEPSHKKALKIH